MRLNRFIIISISMLAFIPFFVQADESPAIGKKYAVVIGVNTYAEVSPLNGCVSDARHFNEILIKKLKFESSNIKLLLNEQASRAGILKAIYTDLIQKVEKEDVAMLYFAGHGVQVEDFSGDESDGADEAICAYDMNLEDPSTWIVDDQLQEMIKTLALRCNNVVFVIDACHSGTATLAPDPADGVREVKNRKLKTLNQGVSSTLDLDQDRYPKNHLLLAASRPDETSKEFDKLLPGDEGRVRGIFTLKLASAIEAGSLDEARFGKVSSDVSEFVRKAGKPSQNPAWYGDLKIMNKVFTVDAP